MELWGFGLWQCIAIFAVIILVFYWKRLAVASGAAAMADNCYLMTWGHRPVRNAPGAEPAAQNAPESQTPSCWLSFLMNVVAYIAVVSVIVMTALTFVDVQFQTTNVESIMNSTVHPYNLWMQAQKEQTRKRLLHEQLCSKVGGDVLEQIEVLTKQGYNVSGIPSTLKSLEEERNSLLAELDALRAKLSAQENITAELQRDNVTCHDKVNRYAFEKRLMANETRMVNANVTELKRQVAAIASGKNDCDASLTQVDRKLSNCKKALAEAEAKEARKKCWV
jgi:hypothetical protein